MSMLLIIYTLYFSSGVVATSSPIAYLLGSTFSIKIKRRVRSLITPLFRPSIPLFFRHFHSCKRSSGSHHAYNMLLSIHSKGIAFTHIMFEVRSHTCFVVHTYSAFMHKTTIYIFHLYLSCTPSSHDTTR